MNITIAIQVSLVLSNFVITRPSPNRRLPTPNSPTIGYICTFVVRIPADTIQKHISIDHTGRYLGPELNLRAGLAPNNGADMGLGYAHNPAIDTVAR